MPTVLKNTGVLMAMLRAVERMEECPLLPEPRNNRRRLGQDLQPVGDYAGIQPYYRVCEDVQAVHHQDKCGPEAFQSVDWWWNQGQIRFLNGKAFIGLSAAQLLIPYLWGGLVLVGGGMMLLHYAPQVELPDELKSLLGLGVVLGWIALSMFLIIKTLPWVMSAAAFLLKPFEKGLSRIMDRSLKAGESYFNRETGLLSGMAIDDLAEVLTLKPYQSVWLSN